MSIFLEEAQRLARLGYKVFQCEVKGKKPFAITAPKGCNSATDDLDIVTKWWTQYPDCNIGIKCENLLVLDLDSNAELNGPRDVRNIADTVGPLPSGPFARTGSGGWHLLFARPEADIVGSRCLFIEGDPREPYNVDAADYRTLPPELIETARWWAEYLPPDPVTGKVGNLAHENPNPRIVPMTDEAVCVLNALGEHADLSYSQTQDPIEQVLWTRVHEIANKLALVYACSVDHENPEIDGPAARWASEFTDWIIRQMMKLVKRNVADSPFAKLVLRAENLFRKRGGMMTRSELSASLRIRPRELDEIIQKMLEEELIEITFCTGTGGRPKTVYKIVAL